MKMKKVLKLNQLNHYFKCWKFIIKIDKDIKIKQIIKPKNHEILILMMKYLFSENTNMKGVLMGKLYFAKKEIFI